MLKKDWPKISERRIKDADYWILNTRRYHNGVRTGNEEYFNKDRYTLKQVEGRADVVRKDVLELGHDIGSVNTRAKIEAADALDKLKPYGKTISQAVEFYLKHLEDQARGGVPLKTAIADWIVTKKEMWDCGDLKERSFKTLEYRIALFEKAFPEKNLLDLSSDVITSFFRDPKYTARSRANIKAVVSEFFIWCVRSKKWIKDNPCDAIEVKVKLEEVDILLLAEAKKLLASSEACPWADHFHPYVLIGLFAGLRPSELQALTWEEIDFETNEIYVESEKDRYVPMNEDLVTALKPYRGEGLIISDKNFRKRWDYVRTAAGFLIEEDADPKKRYPFDGMRHSFASYWLSMSLNGVKGYEGGRPRLAEIMGNSVEIIRNHYRKSISTPQATAYWNLMKPELVTA